LRLALLLAALLLPALQARAAMDGHVTRDEAFQILTTPLNILLGKAEAERVQRVAVANALLQHCALDWHRLFEALTGHHRHGLGRPEAEMSRIVVWHGFWQGQAQALVRRERPNCDDRLRRVATEGAERELRALSPPAR
jgi:hypothetical protein